MPGSDPVNPARSGVKLTYDDFVLFPDDGQRHELIDGEHYLTPSPNISTSRKGRTLGGAEPWDQPLIARRAPPLAEARG